MSRDMKGETVNKMTTNAYRVGALLACERCAFDRSSVARVYATFQLVDVAPWCDYCGTTLAAHWDEIRPE